MDNKKSVIEVFDVKKVFVQGLVEINVLNGITARFEQGKTYAITGASGSGKSTLMYLLAGLDAPDEGSVNFNGKIIAEFSAHQHEHFLSHSVGLLFQQPYLINELSVIENVMLKGFIAGKKEQAYQHATKLLQHVGLEEKAHAQPATLSGGQQQRVALVRAIYNKPDFLIADEPTAHLDVDTGKAMINLLLSCRDEWGMGLIICSHDQYVSRSMETILHLNNGILSPSQDF